ncbi:putative leader peptide [Frankia nepalensis]|nr:putative leader peptide [Frankia nepalensis]
MQRSGRHDFAVPSRRSLATFSRRHIDLQRVTSSLCRGERES